MTGWSGGNVDASEFTELADLVDFTDLMLGNLILRAGVEQMSPSIYCN